MTWQLNHSRMQVWAQGVSDAGPGDHRSGGQTLNTTQPLGEEQAPFNCMAAVTIHSDFGAQENEVRPCFHKGRALVVGVSALIREAPTGSLAPPAV